MKLPEGYVIDGERRDWYLYFLTDGIYPEWSIFVRPNHAPTTLQEQAMTKLQEGRRKDVERLFGVLQGRFRILRSDFHGWSDGELVEIVQACVILHNMLVRLRLNGDLEDEVDEHGRLVDPNEVVQEFLDEAHSQTDGNKDMHIPEQTPHDGANDLHLSWIQQLIGVDRSIRDKQAHVRLREALASHIWKSVGCSWSSSDF